MANSILGEKLPIILRAVEEFDPDNYVEVGCYRCETMKEVSERFPSIKKFYGLDLFEPAPESEIPPRDGPPRTLKEAQEYMPNAKFIKGDSKETVKKLPKLKGRTFVFIDGGHSTETTLADIRNVVEKFPKACIVVDDTTMREVEAAVNLSGMEYDDLGVSVKRIIT